MKRLLSIAALLTVSVGCALAADPTPATKTDSKVVQFDVHEVLNTRVVVTLKDGKITPAKIDIDGAGGHATKAAADFMKGKDPHALPDDGKFPANDRHPEVVLNYSNDDTEKNQALRMPGTGDFSFAVPEKNYTSIYLFTTSGWGKASKLTVEMSYKDGTSDKTDVDAPDWWWDLKKGDKVTFYLAEDLSKFDKNGNMVGGEARHHYINGLEIHPDAAKVMNKVTITKNNKDALFVFYGATGVTKQPPHTAILSRRD